MFCFLLLISVQIILESLPVSSSGHIILLEDFLHYFFNNQCVVISNNKVILHFLHGSAVFIFALFFLNQWLFLLKHITRCWKIIIKIIWFIVIADIITLLFYLFFKNNISFPNVSLGIGFAFTAFMLFVLRYCGDQKYQSLTFGKVLLIGIAQGIALMPGISRFAVTFVVGCLLRLKPQRAFEFSFAIQWPLITISFLNSAILLYANFLPRFKFVYSNSDFFTDTIHLFNCKTFFVIVFASVLSFFALWWVQRLIFANKLWRFSLYMIVPFLAWLYLFLAI